MSASDFLLHLLGFAAPALFTALAVTFASRLLMPPAAAMVRGWAAIAINFIAGLAVLGSGLWYFGRDGKMATYVALVVVVATCQWLLGRGWRARG